MNDHIYWMLELAVKEGQLDAFKTLMGEMVEYVQANEPDALNYEWWINEEGTVCHLYERYADSAALLTHLGGFGANFAKRFMDCVDIKRFIVYGNPNDAARNALSSLGVKFMAPLGGFIR